MRTSLDLILSNIHNFSNYSDAENYIDLFFNLKDSLKESTVSLTKYNSFEENSEDRFFIYKEGTFEDFNRLRIFLLPKKSEMEIILRNRFIISTNKVIVSNDILTVKYGKTGYSKIIEMRFYVWA